VKACAFVSMKRDISILISVLCVGAGGVCEWFWRAWVCGLHSGLHGVTVTRGQSQRVLWGI